MRAASIRRKLRELDVPLERALWAAERFGDDNGTPTDVEKLQRAIKKAARQKLVEQHRREFRVWCRANGLPNPTHEHEFAKQSHRRRWAFDWSWADVDGGGVALEIEGGVHSNGRHVRPSGYLGDVEKYNAASQLGWRLIRVTPATLFANATLELLRAALHPHSESK